MSYQNLQRQLITVYYYPFHATLMRTHSPTKKLDLTELTPQYWEDKNHELGQTLSGWSETLHHLETSRNVKRNNKEKEAGLKETLSQHFVTLKRRKEISPLELFTERTSSHPQISGLKRAISKNNKPGTEKLIKKIGAGGWKNFISHTAPSGTGAFSTYLAEAGGRKVWVLTPADTSPLKIKAEIIIDADRECAYAFAKNFRPTTETPQQ